MRSYSISLSIKSAAFLSAALVVFLAAGWIFVARVQAQGPVEITGQITNGTKDAPANSIENVPITLFQITSAGPVTKSVPTNANGAFTFTDVISDATSYFVRVDYAGIRYFSPIQPAATASEPISLTLYETQTVPANFTIDRMHLILDVQPKRLNGLELVQVTNPGDRAFYLKLPIPANASDVQFQDVREQTTVKFADDGSRLYPILPTTTDLLFGVVLPYTPPDYALEIPVINNIAGFNVLLSQTSGVTLSGANIVAGNPFESESGQSYLVYSAPQQAAGTTFRATVSNLPGVDNTGTLQTAVVIAGALGGLALLAYPVYRRRALAAQAAPVSERVARLQALARLDDAYDAGELDEDDYQAQRATIKAELIGESGLVHD